MTDEELQASLGPSADPPAAPQLPPSASDEELQAAFGPAAPAEAGPREGGGLMEGLQTFGEGLAQGATLGGYGLVTSLAAKNGLGVDSLLSPDYDRERRARAEAHPWLASGGELAGSVLPAVVSGGSGVAAKAAAALPSAVEANLGVKLAGALGERAAAWMGGSTAARILGRAAVTGVESAADQAVRRVLDDAANGDVEVTSERMLDAAWNGFAGGSMLDAGLGTLGAAGRALGPLAGKIAKSARDAIPGDLSDAAGEAAYKAALGRTDIKSIRLAARHGGAAEVGKTLLERGLVQAGDTVDDIAERLPAAREQAGKELRSILGEVADGKLKRSGVWDRIESEVLAPLEKPGTEDIAQAVRDKLQASGLARGLGGPLREGEQGLAEHMTLGELHAHRKALDSRPDLKWGSAGPQAPDITTEAMRDVRRAIEDAFEEASDRAASKAGIEGYADKLRAAKRAYAHLATAADVAEQGAFARASRNRLGLNDTLAGVAGAASLGPLGAAAALGSKVLRERSESTIAAGLQRLAQRQRARVVMDQLAQGAVKTEGAITRAADDAVKGIFGAGRSKPGLATELASVGVLNRSMQRAVAMQDPASPDAQMFAAHVQTIAGEDPQLANALQAKMQARAQFLAGKLAPQVDASDPLQRDAGAQDSATGRKNMRYVQAALDPEGALKRMSHGVGTAEDIETLRALTPRLYQRYVQQVQQRVEGAKRAPSLRERRRLAYLTGQPMDRASEPATAAWLQTLKAPPPTAPQTDPNLTPMKASAPRPSSGSGEDNRFATRSDSLLGD